MPNASEHGEVTIRPMAAADAAAVTEMARELAAAVDDPDPVLDPRDLVRDGTGPDVRPDARRTGAGRALMAAIARLSIAKGCEAVYWDLWRLNRVGKAFYERLGAVEVGDLAIWRVGSRQLAAGGEE
jgi:GNAT superfamily N-acetyltransferase